MIKNQTISTKERYVTPGCTVLDVRTTGVLCNSFNGNSIEDATEDSWSTL